MRKKKWWEELLVCDALQDTDIWFILIYIKVLHVSIAGPFWGNLGLGDIGYFLSAGYTVTPLVINKTELSNIFCQIILLKSKDRKLKMPHNKKKCQ